MTGSVDDAEGSVDVDLICPFHNVPWWNSTLEPPAGTVIHVYYIYI